MKDTLLVFDDDRLTLRSIARVIHGTFDEILTAQTAAQAEELLGSHQVTHLLCDRNLAEQMRGEQFIAKWREQWPSIRYAALMSGEDASHLLDQPTIDMVFPKPFEPSEVREALAAARKLIR